MIRDALFTESSLGHVSLENQRAEYATLRACGQHIQHARGGAPTAPIYIRVCPVRRRTRRVHARGRTRGSLRSPTSVAVHRFAHTRHHVSGVQRTTSGKGSPRGVLRSQRAVLAHPPVAFAAATRPRGKKHRPLARAMPLVLAVQGAVRRCTATMVCAAAGRSVLFDASSLVRMRRGAAAASDAHTAGACRSRYRPRMTAQGSSPRQ